MDKKGENKSKISILPDSKMAYMATWLSTGIDAKGQVIDAEVTKKVTFNALNRRVESQHKLHFMIVSLFNGNTDDDDITINTDKLLDITKKAINCLIVISEEFTEIDKKELLTDSMALLPLGMTLFKEVFTPFFSTLKMS
jgi:hypothetical protein